MSTVDAVTAVIWQLAGTAPGSVETPAELPSNLVWTAVDIPNTVAGALRDAGRPVPSSGEVDGTDWWLRATVVGDGPHLLDFEGLATVADVWLDDTPVLHAESMFRRHRAEVHLTGTQTLTVRCAAPLAWLGKRPRPRWKSALVRDQRWRWLRTTVFGRIPTWTGTIAPAGIWRPVHLRPLDAPVLAAHRLASRVDGGDGVLEVDLDLRGPARIVTVQVSGADAVTLTRGADDRWRGTVRVPDVALWWPSGYGAQPRYPVVVHVDGVPVHTDHIAFRTLTHTAVADGFTVSVNGVPVFLRGAVWQPIDSISLASDPAEARAALAVLRDGGHTVVRVPATGVYETDDFYAVCDELGLLVWQDFALTALDPPDTPEFLSEVADELVELADRLAGRACLAVVCGGAETEQQPALLGQPPQPIPVLSDTLPAVLREHLPDIAYIANTPTGGGLPVHTDAGIAQYFGVSAYLRPLLDVRAAGVRFAGECLAFSNPPERTSVLDAFGSERVAGHAPEWKAGVPRDPSAGWDFEDVRDHYVAELFGVDVTALRMADSARYLDLGRAAVCAAMVEVLSWWRRPRSGCGGGIVLSARDFTDGAGWGIVAADGRPKAPWHALAPVLAPTAVLVGDDGGAGVSVTVVHDGAEPVRGTLELRMFGPGGAEVAAASIEVTVEGHGAAEISLDSALGRFTDANHYYRFGPRSCDALQAQLVSLDGSVLAGTTALLGAHLRPPASLEASTTRGADGWQVELTAAGVVQWVAIECETHTVARSWFHLAPGETRTVALAGPDTAPVLTVRALNVVERVVTPRDSTVHNDTALDGIAHNGTVSRPA